VRSNLYRIWLKHCASCIYFCDYSALPNSFDGEVLLDIDVDYFIYSCTGCLIKGSSYCINMEVLEQLPQIKFLSHQAHITTISLSVFGGYVPIEFQFLGSWLEEYFFTTSGEEALKELEIVAELYNRNKCISYKLHYIPGPAVSLLNACSSYKIGCYRRSANFFSGVSQGFISKYRNFLTNWEYFFFLRGDECLRCSMEEINKYLIWLNDSELYNQKRAWLYYRLERYQEMCDIVETLQQENIHTTFLRAVLAYHLHNWDSFYKYRNQLFACCKDVLGVKEITAYSDYEKLRLFSEAMHLA